MTERRTRAIVVCGDCDARRVSRPMVLFLVLAGDTGHMVMRRVQLPPLSPDDTASADIRTLMRATDHMTYLWAPHPDTAGPRRPACLTAEDLSAFDFTAVCVRGHGVRRAPSAEVLAAVRRAAVSGSACRISAPRVADGWAQAAQAMC